MQMMVRKVFRSLEDENFGWNTRYDSPNPNMHTHAYTHTRTYTHAHTHIYLLVYDSFF